MSVNGKLDEDLNSVGSVGGTDERIDNLKQNLARTKERIGDLKQDKVKGSPVFTRLKKKMLHLND